ncbi:MAG: hypothetical protein HDR54_04105 [Treponema sp.]|nr:hypothetical protein [Treponema sp.]
MKKFSKCMALLATLSLLFSLFSCKQEPDDPDLSEVSVDLKEKEKVFFEGDTLSKEDVVVMAFYSDRSTKDVTNKAKFTPELPCTLTTSFDLTIDYEEKKAALKIEVGKKTDYYEDESGKRIKLKEILLALKDSDKQFFEGDVISKDDFVVTAKYEDDTTKIVTDGVTFEGLTDEKLTVGNKTIRATYGSQVKSLDIAVHERGAKVTSILLTLKAGRTFFVGDTISTDDFTVIAIFSDGTTEDVTNKSEFEGIGRTTTAGKVTIIASYDSKTKNCEVTVQAKTVASISLALKQQDKIVVVGDAISASDFIVTATYNNGTTEDVTSKSQISGLENLTQAGKVKITATYETKSASLDITVRANGVTLTDILLALKTDKTFVVGDTISKSDFIVTATFSDGATEDVTSASQFTGLGKITKAGNVEITVTYNSLLTTLGITVSAKPVENTKVVSISLSLKDRDRTFVVGETIYTDDFTVIATYSDGSTMDVTWYSSFEGLGKQTESGNVKITATYSSKTASITVKVVIPETLYIYDYNETVGDWEWKSMQVEKEGSCFYYEFQNVGTIYLQISTSKSWSGRIEGGVAIPQTGDYVVLNNYNSEDTTVVIANLEDRIYIRYEEGIYYARYVSSDDESFDPDEEIKAVESILFDIGFDDVDEIGFSYVPEYMLEGDKLEVKVYPYSESAPCTYEYQWYKNGEEVVGETLVTSPNFEKGNSYCCVVTAISIDNPQYRIEKCSPGFYVCSTDMDEVSLSDTNISLNATDIIRDLMVKIDSTRYYDSIKWKTSDAFVVALDGYENAFDTKTDRVTLRAIGNGKSTITVTMTRRGVEKSFTCTVTVSGLNVEEEEYSWWYYELDTSEASDSQLVNLIFNNPEGNPNSLIGDCKTNDIEDVQSKGEIFYKWNGKDTFLFAEVDKSKVEESILQAGLDTENKLVVYVSVPVGFSPVYLYAWDKTSTLINLPNTWPGVLMKECTASDENPAE